MATAEREWDLVIVGGGPAGYVAGIRAGQLGLRTALVERERLGGVCLNWGCIPTKALLRNAEVVSLIRQAEEWGVRARIEGVDFAPAVDRSRRVVDRLVRGVQYLMRKNRVEVVQGEGVLRGPDRVEVKETGQVLRARAVILATGARPATLPLLPVDGERVLTSREALERRDLPASIVIVGGGAVGVEFAYLYNAYGVQVTVVELLPHLLPREDEEVGRALERAFQKQGIRVLTNARLVSAQREGQGVRLTVRVGEATETLEAERVLVAVGIRPNTEGLGLEEVGVAVDAQGFIQVDDRMRTSVPGVYAIGDVTGKLPLAHVGSAQGVLAVEAIAGREVRPLDYDGMPRAVYCRPQVASFGLTEAEARRRGHEVKVGTFPFTASGKALAQGEAEGFVKVVADARYGEVLGAHLIGPEVTELLPELSLARMLEGTVHEVGAVVHAHPTLAEAVKEACLAVLGEAIHI